MPLVTRAGEVALVEDEVDHGEHAAQPVGQLGGRRAPGRGCWPRAILRLARVIRCAIVRSGTRNALAISGTVSPPIRRRVSATCASGASAGWQQVKSRRSRSSVDRGPTGAEGSSAVLSMSASSWRASTGRLATQPVQGLVARGGGEPAAGVGRQRRRSASGAAPPRRPPGPSPRPGRGRRTGRRATPRPCRTRRGRRPIAAAEPAPAPGRAGRRSSAPSRAPRPGGSPVAGGLTRPGRVAPRPCPGRPSTRARRARGRRRGRAPRRPRSRRSAPWTRCRARRW